MKKAFKNLFGMIAVGLIAFGLSLFINEFILEYTNSIDSALVAAMTGMILYSLRTWFK